MGTEGGSDFLIAVENLTSVWMNLQAKYVLQVIICATQNLHSPCQTIAHIHMHTHPTTTTHTLTHTHTHLHTHTNPQTVTKDRQQIAHPQQRVGKSSIVIQFNLSTEL